MASWWHTVRFVRCRRGLTPNPPSPKRLSNHDMQPITAISLSFSSVACSPHFKIFIFLCSRFVLEHLEPFWFGTKIHALNKSNDTNFLLYSRIKIGFHHAFTMINTCHALLAIS
jgi:hypothetical protein